MSKGFDEGKYHMSYKQIADVLTSQEGVEYTEEQVKKICQRALKKLKDKDLLKDFVPSSK